MADIQAALEEQFSPPLDSSLVAAIAHEPGQTLQSARELCETLAAAAIEQDHHLGRADDAAHKDTSASADTIPLDRSPQAPQRKSKDASPFPAAGRGTSKASMSSRRRHFGGQLTSSSPVASPLSSSPKTSSLDTDTFPDSITSHDYGGNETGSTTPTSTSSAAPDVDSVQRLLDEWQLIDQNNHDPDNLRLTDEENDTDTELASIALDQNALRSIEQKELREADRVATAAGDGRIDPAELAKGEQSLSSLPADQLPESISEEERFDPLVFLQHAFPSRTPAFLKETLDDARGSIQDVIDTLMTIDLIESEDARQAELGAVEPASLGQAGSARERAKGLDYDALAKGLAAREGLDASLKGKKRKAARRRMQEEQRRAAGQAGMLTVGLDSSRRSNAKPAKVKVNLTDVRHGAPIHDLPAKLARAPAKAKAESVADRPAVPLTDEELAAKLAAEEEELAADPDDNQPVRDNAWLLTSSVLSQLSTLLDLEATKITSIYNGASFNLALAFARCVEFAADRYQTLDSLDKAGEAPAGTAKRMCDGIAGIAGTDRAQASKAFRATRGRQDATLDLLQLEQVVRTATGDQELDALDPLGKLSHPDSDFTAEAVGARGVSVEAGATAGKFREAFPTPSQAARFGRGQDTSTGATDKYARAVGRKEPGPPTGAAAALRSGAAIAAVLPASAASVVRDPDVGLSDIPNERLGLAPHISAHDPLRRMTEYRLIADEYRQRRDEALRKAGNAWRSGKGGVRIGGKGGDGGKGGTAWYYADEARRLDAKSRAWSLKAAEALVEDRRRAGVGVVRGDVSSHLRAPVGGGGGSSGGQSNAFNTIDLHGVTVHEALSIVREQVTRWYARPSTSGHLAPFKIITGVGRHSPHQIAVLRPAVAKMLEREGWRYDVDHSRGIIIVRGTK
ncbi:uncharacterized protein PFL1_00431 [Pseudozyma flocculosa PF-1]|uniref:Smr domain-containing protein n=1 Tax=Pseudozyma flocculosa TaxID=84751 RepID=A0A5C3ERG7_9BASI|nr:uncharacterized protein PFL1_00431 [Pseudozyma flocculosa PF-1]EPQ32234.1 hypothetical protein PFL1_00431 [Pseudozyma flocculosa PF-1]SPO34818.1 uncharacterized protein PSFLO_00289 [Pseudozyma flocculosa]